MQTKPFHRARAHPDRQTGRAHPPDAKDHWPCAWKRNSRCELCGRIRCREGRPLRRDATASRQLRQLENMIGTAHRSALLSRSSCLLDIIAAKVCQAEHDDPDQASSFGSLLISRCCEPALTSAYYPRHAPPPHPVIVCRRHQALPEALNMFPRRSIPRRVTKSKRIFCPYARVVRPTF